MKRCQPRRARPGRAAATGLLGASLLAAAAGCGSSDAGSVDVAASKAVAVQKGLSTGGPPAGKSAGLAKRGQAPKAAPSRASNR